MESELVMNPMYENLVEMMWILIPLVIFALVLRLINYIAGSMMYYSIAKQKGDEMAWFAWIPYLRQKTKTEISDGEWHSKFGENAGWKVVGVIVLLDVLASIGRGESGVLFLMTMIVGLAAFVFWILQNYYFFKVYTKDAFVVMVLCIIPFYYPVKALKIRKEVLMSQLNEPTNS